MKHRLRHLGSSILILSLLPALLLPGLAQAHVGDGQSVGIAHGFEHPFGGVDHLLAMLAIGIWAAQRGGRALWVIPATFVLAVALGGAIGALGIVVPFVEQNVALSVLSLGALIATAARLPLPVSALLAGVFALLHGYAHGAEMPANSWGIAYLAGLVFATTILHGIGIGSVLLARSAGRIGLVRYSGGMIAASAVYLWLGSY